MNLRKILFPAFIGLFLLSFAADARYIFVLPPAGAANPVLQGFSEQFISMGAPVPVPSDTFQVLTNLNATKAILISANSTSPVSFLNIQNGQLVGPVRPLNLEDKAARAAALSPDGSKLLVVAGANPGVLFVIDLNTETLAPSGRIQVPLEPRDLVVSADSRLAFVLSIGTPNTLSVVDLATSIVVSQQAVARVSGSMAISMSPAGSVYVTSQYALIEYNPLAPYLERARSGLVTQPGKLYFSPDGRYALAKNILGNGSSVIALDLATKNADYPAGIQVSSAPITTPGSNIPLQIDELAVISNTMAIAYVASVPKMYLVQYPALSASELNLNGIGSPSSVSGIAVSDEFPASKNLYYNNAGNISRHDLITNNQIGVNVATPGPLTFLTAVSTAAVTDMVAYGAGQIVAPSAQLRPYFVRVADSQGRPVYNAQVSFFADTAGVSLSTPLAMTNMFGYAQVTATAPGVNGEFSVRAVSGSTATVIKSTVTGGTTGGGGGGPAPSGPRIVRISGDGQLRRWFDGFTDPLVVRVEDGLGNPLAGKQVTWTEQGGANFSGPTITTTDANGVTQAIVIPAGTFTPGTAYLQYTITANTDIGNTVFTMTAFPTTCGVFCPPPQIELKNPTQDNRSLTVKLGAINKDAIRALVYSGGGNNSNPTPIQGVALNISTPFTDPKLGIVAKCEGGTPLSGADGYVSCNLIATGPVGSTRINVNVGAAIDFNNISLNVTPGDPIAPVIKQGNNQTGKPGATLPLPLSLNITDAYGNVLSGVPVAWSVTPLNAVTLLNVVTQSDTNGNASARVILGPTAGVVQVKAAAGGKEAVFSITIESLVTGVVKISGDGQPVTPVNQPFPSPLIVQVNDAQNRPVAGSTIQWGVTSGVATLSATSVTTGADGRAQVTVTAGTVASSIVITASLQGFTPITFNLQSRLPGPVLSTGSFVNWATNEPGLAPGNLVLVTGTGIAPNLKGTVSANLLTGALPYTLAGVTLKFTSNTGVEAYAPIYRVSNENNVESMLVQVPFEINGSGATAVMDVSGGTTTVTGIPVRISSPGILEEMIAGRRAAVAVRSDGLYVSPTYPARPGEVIRIYTIGLGQTTPAVDTNRVGSVDQKVGAVVAVGLDDKGVELISVHTAENLVGVYEIVFRVPLTVTQGADRPLGFLIEAVPGQVFYSNPSILSIGQ